VRKKGQTQARPSPKGVQGNKTGRICMIGNAAGEQKEEKVRGSSTSVHP